MKWIVILLNTGLSAAVFLWAPLWLKALWLLVLFFHGRAWLTDMTGMLHRNTPVATVFWILQRPANALILALAAAAVSPLDSRAGALFVVGAVLHGIGYGWFKLATQP